MWDFDDALFDRLEKIDGLAAEMGVPSAQYSLAWALSQPAMSSLVVGVKSQQQIQDAVTSLNIEIPADHFDQIDAACPPPWRQPDPVRS